MNQGTETNWLPIIIWAIVGLIAFIALLCWVCPIYGVWAARKRGEADLAEAEGEQKIQIAQAESRLKSADLNKQAEMIDASAVAKSVEIIGTALHNNEGYMRWQWIRMMEQKDAGDVIYVPTEANLPILEAGKRRQPTQTSEEV